MVSRDRPDSPDQPVCGRLLDEVVQAPALALGGEQEAAVLHEASVVAEVGDVLPCSTSSCLATFGHRVGPCLVGGHPLPLEQLGEVGPYPVEIELFGSLTCVERVVGACDDSTHLRSEERRAGKAWGM